MCIRLKLLASEAFSYLHTQARKELRPNGGAHIKRAHLQNKKMREKK